MTPRGEQKLIEHEGECLSAYQDSEGWWTIGIGHLIDARKGGRITKRASRILFDDDVAFYTASARANFPWIDHLDAVRQDVIVMLCFNMGVEGLKTFHLMIAAIEQEQWDQAAFELFNSLWARQVQPNRRDELCNALETGKWT